MKSFIIHKNTLKYTKVDLIFLNMGTLQSERVILVRDDDMALSLQSILRTADQKRFKI